MSIRHTGNVQPQIDKEEHSHVLEPATKRVLMYGLYDGGAGKSAVKVNSGGELIVSSSSEEQALRLDDTTTANVVYVGVAPIGTAPSQAAWQIRKIDTTSGLVITWADGNSNYDNVWDDRALLSYS